MKTKQEQDKSLKSHKTCAPLACCSFIKDSYSWPLQLACCSPKAFLKTLAWNSSMDDDKVWRHPYEYHWIRLESSKELETWQVVLDYSWRRLKEGRSEEILQECHEDET